MEDVPIAELDLLAGGKPLVAIDGLKAGYGRARILHGLSLRLARRRALCLVGPNGAGKSTVLNAMYGFAKVFAGSITVGGHDLTRLPSSGKLKAARLAYVLQGDSVFPNMTVEENLLMGGYLLEHRSQAKAMA
ncbi:MAG TPA: ATP-binding cassette domain-containing protein, partial [Methyloceanibacter sp.]|nr:ATP-binding cassette domain-containing protein [Methyloceanibacter sp.]